MTIPSYQVKPGETIEISDTAQAIPDVAQRLAEQRGVPPFLRRDGAGGTVVHRPEPGDANVLFDVRQVIEFYAR